VYVNVLAALGFIAATVLFLVASLVLAGARRPLPLVLIPALLAGGIHYVFVVLFRVSLPRGLIERLLS
jgi:putative tricarboxylic transport membrane protein